MDRPRFIDCDSHLLEPSDLWEKYLEPGFRSEMPRTRAGYTLAGIREGENRDGLGPAGPALSFALEVSVCGCDMPVGRQGGRPSSMPPGMGDVYLDYARRGFPASCYLEAMATSGVDYMVLYPSVGLYTCHAPSLSGPTAAAYRRAANNWLADFCSEGGGRLIGVGGIDLRDPEEAAREATRCVDKLGFKAVFVNPAPVGAQRMYERHYDRLWATIADLNVPLGLHAAANTACDPMLYDYLPGLGLAQVITAFSVGNMIASAALIMGGVLERHPRLRVVHLESGAGWPAFWLYRMKAGLLGSLRDVDQPDLKMDPVDYFRRQCYVAADPDDPGIKQLIEVVGDDNVVIGTDFGHLEGNRFSRAVEEVLNLPDVGEESKRKMLWDNALRLYPIDVG